VQSSMSAVCQRLKDMTLERRATTGCCPCPSDSPANPRPDGQQRRPRNQATQPEVRKRTALSGGVGERPQPVQAALASRFARAWTMPSAPCVQVGGGGGRDTPPTSAPSLCTLRPPLGRRSTALLEVEELKGSSVRRIPRIPLAERGDLRDLRA